MHQLRLAPMTARLQWQNWSLAPKARRWPGSATGLENSSLFGLGCAAYQRAWSRSETARSQQKDTLNLATCAKIRGVPWGGSLHPDPIRPERFVPIDALIQRLWGIASHAPCDTAQVRLV